jgi:hypothetical protein
MADLSGPKMRDGKLGVEKVQLQAGGRFTHRSAFLVLNTTLPRRPPSFCGTPSRTQFSAWPRINARAVRRLWRTKERLNDGKTKAARF